MTIEVRSERMSDIDKLLSVGAGMANTLFNLAQGADLTDDVRQSLTDQRKAWDDARRQYHASANPTPVSIRSGIYIASKTAHAPRWRDLRAAGVPIISTWIDEAGQGESGDLSDLWRRCILEASTARVLILYREPDEVLKGGWIELGAALASGVTVFAVGIDEFTVAKFQRIHHFETLDAALATATEASDV